MPPLVPPPTLASYPPVPYPPLSTTQQQQPHTPPARRSRSISTSTEPLTPAKRSRIESQVASTTTTTTKATQSTSPQQHYQTQKTRTSSNKKKTHKPFVTPFITPRASSLEPTKSSFAPPSSSSSPPSSPLHRQTSSKSTKASSFTPSHRPPKLFKPLTLSSSSSSSRTSLSPSQSTTTPKPTSSKPKPAYFKPPTPLSTSTTSTTSSSRTLAIKITTLERKLHLLRQAVKYRRMSMEDEKGGDGELERLCERWKDGGRMAAEALWEHADSLVTDGSTTGGGYSNDSPFGNDDLLAKGGGGWESSWGFADSSSSPSFSNNAFSSSFSWGFSSSTLTTTDSSISLEAFNSQIDTMMLETGRRKLEVLRDVEEMLVEGDEDGGKLVSGEEALERSLKAREGKRRKVTVVKREEESDEEDEVLKLVDKCLARSERKGKEVDRATEEEEEVAMEGVEEMEGESQGSEREEDEKKEQEKWNLGKLMKLVGADPELFGLDEEGELVDG